MREKESYIGSDEKGNRIKITLVLYMYMYTNIEFAIE